MRKGFVIIQLILGLAAVAIIATAVVFTAQRMEKQKVMNTNTPANVNGVACTADAMLCPDGVTYVGRQGPDCEFAACPEIADLNVNGIPNANIDNTNVRVNTNAAVNTNIAVSVNDWKTYTNETGHYLIRYPKDWTNTADSSDGTAMFYDSRALSQDGVGDLIIGSKIEIYIRDNYSSAVTPSFTPLDEGSTLLSEIATTIDAKAARRRTFRSSYGGIIINELHTLSQKKLFNLIQYIPEDAKVDEYTSIFDQILTTFQFTD